MKHSLKGIGYQVFGSGQPVFFLHGGPGMTSHYLEYFVEVFSKLGYQCFLIDQRGNGLSKAYDTTTITYDQILEDFEAIRLAHGLEDIFIIGHSFGGYIGLRYLMASPAIKKGIIISSIPTSEEWLEKNQESRSQMLSQVDLDLEHVPDHMPLAYYKFFSICYPDQALFKRRLPDIFDPTMDITRCNEITGALYPAFTSSLPLALETIQQPVLVLHGDGDFIPYGSSEALARQLPNSDFVLIPGAGHFPFDENRAGFAKILDDFLKS